jgi:thiopeptide-type bacteriocin biosynthesis protein
MHNAKDRIVCESPACVIRIAAKPASWWLGLSDDERRARIAHAIDTPEIREALFVGSSELLAEIESKGVASPKTFAAVSRYFARLAGRSTPFGMFAAVGSLPISTCHRTMATLSDDGLRRHVRLDNDTLHRWCARLNAVSEIRRDLSYVPNDSLVFLGEYVHYVKTEGAGQTRRHHLARAKLSSSLQAVLHFVRGGARYMDILTHLAHEVANSTESERDAYLMGVIDAQLIVSRVWPPVMAANPIEHVRDELARAARDIEAQAMDKAHRAITVLNDRRSVDAQDYTALAALVPFAVPANRLVQVDCATRVTGALAQADVARLVRAVGVLAAMTGPAGESPLDHFKKRFDERYQGRLVPLLEALDEEVGIGFGGLPTDTGRPTTSTARERLLVDLFARSAQDAFQPIEITPDDLRVLDGLPTRTLSPTLAVMALVGRDTAGRTTFAVRGVMGGTATRLLGRFAHCSEDIRALVDGIVAVDKRAYGEFLNVEIAHLPDGRLGNILQRPSLREGAVEYLGCTASDAPLILQATDLLVTVRQDWVLLYSARHRRWVQPFLSSAHNLQRGLPVYKFLTALQFRGSPSSLGWNWGPLTAARQLPRVMFDGVALTRAEWRLNKEDLSGDEFLQTLRRTKGIPRWILMAHGDNELPLDLESRDDRNALTEQVDKSGSVRVLEMFPDPEHLLVRSPLGAHVAECIVPLTTTMERPLCPPSLPVEDEAVGPHRFGPGSQWKFASIYTGEAMCDRLLAKAVPELLKRLRARCGDVRWFFIRYADPESHLRLRVSCMNRDAEIGQRALGVLSAWLEELLSRGMAWKVRLDTYEREAYRYGGRDGILLAETIFWLDSEQVHRMITSGALRDPIFRLLAATAGIDAWLSRLGLNIVAKQAFVERWSASLEQQLREDRKLRIAAGERYRERRPVLDRLLNRTPAEPGERIVCDILDDQQYTIGAVPSPLLVDPFVHSICHMHVNRILESLASTHERVLWDWLRRAYISQQARSARRSAERD